MNAVSLLFHKVGTGAPAAVAISPIARAVKDELERCSDGYLMRQETHEDVAALYLDGFSDAEAAAELYPGMLLFEPHEFSHHGLLAREYTSILGIYCQKVLVGSDDWELSEDAYLNTLRVAERLAPNVFLGTAGASKFLNPVVERAAATGKTKLIDAIAAVSNAAVLSKAQDSGYMHDHVEKWLKAIGLSTDAILKDLVAGLLEERRQIVDAAAAPLDTLIERVLDNEISFYKLTKGRYAEFDAVVGTSPEERGQALQYLLDLVVDEGQCRNFNYLGRRNGRWPHQCGGWEKPGVHLDQLAAILARFVHPLVDRDATHAKLIVVLKQSNTAYSALSPLVLRELLKTVAQHPDGRTVQALRVLMQMAAYASWRYPLEKMLAKTAPNDLGYAKLPLELPEWTIGKYQAADNFAGHYANLFEPQLYADPHDTYIRRVVAVYPKLYEAQESGTGKEDLKHLLAAELERAGLASALEPEDDMTWFEAIDFLQSGARLFVLREALRPMAEKYPDVLKELSELVASITMGATPSDKWLHFARNIFDRMAPSDWLQGLEGITQHDAPEHSVHGSRGEPYVRTLIYIGSHLPAADVGPVLAQYALKKCYVTEPGVGIRSEKLGNACVWALANLPDGGGVPYLAGILARTKYPKIRTKIEAELNRAAAMAGISRVDLDEASVPTHDLDRDGKRTVQFDNGSTTLITEGNSARIERANAAGKPVKAATTAMKQEKDLLKKVRADLKELQSDLSIQPQRLQKLYLQDRSWSVNEWRERYLEHPLM